MQATTEQSGPGALERESALREMARIALPAVVGMLSFSMMQFVDRLLCSRLISPEAMTAAGNGGIASWVPGAVLMGILGVVNTFVAQHLGAGRPEKGAAYAWAGLWLALVAWVVVLLPYATVFPWVYEGMRGVLGLDAVAPEIAAMEATYGRCMLVSMILTLVARALGHYFYGMHRPFVVMTGTIAGNAVNLAVSFCLIQWVKADAVSLAALTEFGGGPVAADTAHRALFGAALGTAAGLLVEAAIPAIVFLSPASRRTYGTLAAWRPAWGPVRDLWRLGWPGGVMFGNELVCWWIFMGGFVASFDRGSGMVTHGQAGWITHQYLMLSFMPAVGISIATTAIVGRCIGAGRYDLAQARTWLAVRLTLAYMGTCALGFVLFGEAMARVFMQEDLDPVQAAEIVRLTKWMLILAATFQLFDGLAITLSGALRGAGDTVWPGVATIFLSWGLIVGGGWLAVKYLPQFSSSGPWVMSSLYIIALSLALLWRFLGGHWKTIKVLGPEAGEGVEGGRPVLASDLGPGELAMAPGLDIPVDVPGSRAGDGSSGGLGAR